jgi:hypothetical protein
MPVSDDEASGHPFLDPWFAQIHNVLRWLAGTTRSPSSRPECPETRSRNVRKLDRGVSGRLAFVEAQESAKALRQTIGPGRLMLAGGEMSWPSMPWWFRTAGRQTCTTMHPRRSRHRPGPGLPLRPHGKGLERALSQGIALGRQATGSQAEHRPDEQPRDRHQDAPEHETWDDTQHHQEPVGLPARRPAQRER